MGKVPAPVPTHRRRPSYQVTGHGLVLKRQTLRVGQRQGPARHSLR